MTRASKRNRDSQSIDRHPQVERFRRLSGQQKGDPYRVEWKPPASPFGLLEEELYDDPWKLLVGCLLLNRTSITQVRQVIWDFFSKWPDAHSAISARLSDLYAVLRPLGFGMKRAQYIKTFSYEYLNKEWKDPKELKGMGDYASDAYFIFCKGAWRDVQPTDKELRRYIAWLQTCHSLGFFNVVFNGSDIRDD